MAGLLDFLNTDEGKMGLALLAAAGPTPYPASFGQRLQGAMGQLQADKAMQTKQGLLSAQMDEYKAQSKQREADATVKAAELERQRRIAENLPSLFGGASAPGTGATGNVNAALPPELQIGALPALPGASGMPQGGFDWRRAVALGMRPEEIEKYAGLSNIGRSEVARTVEVDDGKGGKMTLQLDKFGQPVGQGMPGYIAPVQVNQGDRVTFVRPSAGVALPVGMSPAERDASARGWATVNQGAQRLALDQSNAVAGKAPPGYRYKQDGSLEAIPGGPADLRNNPDAAKKVGDAKDVLDILNDVEKLLPKATGSYAGAGYDAVAGGLFGATTEGAKATAQLKALQGILVSKMPKMSGPQSDKDVQLYREMAGQVGDPTIPVAARQAAVDTIRKLNEKYAGVPEGSSKPKTEAMANMPAANASNKGKFLTDTQTGKRFQSNGIQWVEVQ